MNGYRLGIFAALLLGCLAASRTAERAALQVGWHDEMNGSPERRWRWDPPRGAAELSRPRQGVLRLTIGDSSESGMTTENPPRAYYWASAYRYLQVDLDRYPVLAVQTAGVHGAATWWDAILQEYTGGSGLGAETRATLSDAQKPGLLLFDVPAKTGLGGRRRIRLRLNVAGLSRGGWADYRYVRFIRREDADWLRENPGLQRVKLEP